MLRELKLEFRPVPGLPGWHQTLIGDWQKLEARVLQLQDRNKLNGWQLVCGLREDDDGHAIYAIEGMHAVELARAFGTGTHNCWHAPETDQACAELNRIYKILPFRPYFVDAAGYKCRFERRISKKQAAQVEQILTVGLEGYYGEWSGEGPVLANTVIVDNGLRLWWD
ncbi:MAG: hypothetical protein M5U26_18390 [Planctomycetota bacterium]|nr:hypothetical protein [Planctomycetota bacterium]